MAHDNTDADGGAAGTTGGRPVFAHPIEREFAQILDFYGLKWEYEPRSFPLRWEDGRVVEMLTPDFHLKELDLYVELTTMKQSLVTEKNRKIRHMRELYPEVNIKLLYRRDFHRILAKYGFGPLANADAQGIDRVLLTTRQIHQRVARLGRQISEDYRGKQPVLVGVQRGMVCFMAHLRPPYISLQRQAISVGVSRLSRAVRRRTIPRGTEGARRIRHYGPSRLSSLIL